MHLFRGICEATARKEQRESHIAAASFPRPTAGKGSKFFPCRIPLKPLHLDSLSSASLFPPRFCFCFYFSLCSTLWHPDLQSSYSPSSETVRTNSPVSEASPSSRLPVSFPLLLSSCSNPATTATGNLIPCPGAKVYRHYTQAKF